MSRRRRGPSPAPAWEPLYRVVAVRRGTTEEVPAEPDTEHWANARYFVTRRTLVAEGGGAPIVWLSIHRTDRKPVRDWRHLQRIKNELVGPDCEGVELYPAEARLVDTSNEYHLWVVSDPSFRWPWGYPEREVMDADDPKVTGCGAVQRPLDASLSWQPLA